MAVQTQIQVRRGTAATWTSTNPTLAAGEVGFETDTGKFKIGDGSSTWNGLAYNTNGAIAASIVDAKGDLIAATAADAVARVAVGTDGQVLTADSASAAGVKWGAPSLTGASVYYPVDINPIKTVTATVNLPAGWYSYALSKSNDIATIGSSTLTGNINAGPATGLIQLTTTITSVSIANNGIAWTKNGTQDNYSSGIAYGAGKYITVGGQGYQTSYDSYNWKNYPATTFFSSGSLTSITYGNGLFALAGYLPTSFAGRIGTSTDGITWSTRFIYSTGYPTSINYSNGLFVATHTRGILLTSTDAITWTSRVNPFSSTASTTASSYGNGLYLIANSGNIATSTDGVSWTSRTTGTASTINAIVYGNGLYVIGGNGGVILTSTDTITWTARTSNTTSTINAIVYGNGLFVVAGNNAFLTASTDGVTWITQASSTADTLKAGMYINETFYILSGPATNPSDILKGYVGQNSMVLSAAPTTVQAT
jgi:hypothetical protein